MAAAPRQIMVEAAKARRNLQDLCAETVKKIDSRSLPSDVHADKRHLGDCVDRFNIWAGSLGVFQKGDASLDARLSSHLLLHEVVRLLKQLDAFTLELSAIITGSREQRIWTKSALRINRDEFSDPEDFSSDEDAENVSEPGSDENGSSEETFFESQDLHLSIDESITSLLRLSALVSKSSRKAKFTKSSINGNYAVGPDISHIKDFFPHAAENIVLIERLGKANAQRRQWLWYRQRHREKLSVDFSSPMQQRLSLPGFAGDADEGSVAIFSDVDKHDIPAPSLTGTKASTFRSRLTPSMFSGTRAPETVFGRSSMAASDEQRLMIPEPPHDLILGQPYYCRYCCNMVEISGRHAWQKHVHEDLSSYACTFPNCDEVFFESRHKWWNHEMECHRKHWRCGVCNTQQPSRVDMVNHLRNVHSDQIPNSQEEIIADKFGRPVKTINAADCPLCDYTSILRRRGLSDEEILHLSPDKFRRHLSRHLEQVALFVLPISDLLEENEASDNGAPSDDESDNEDVYSGVETKEQSVAELVLKLAGIASSQMISAENPSKPPNLAMRWQPPQDFTPPLDDFYTDDIDLLPERQEPIFGGDLHTPGWARGTGHHKEGFCARCPVSHWVNIPDGSYAFHLTYFHGVPASGVPLPRPSTVPQLDSWEGFCEVCENWRLLKKTRRGWNWYRHWLDDHTDIVKSRTDAIRNGSNPEFAHLSISETVPITKQNVNAGSLQVEKPDLKPGPEQLTQCEYEILAPHLFALAKQDKSNMIEILLVEFRDVHTAEELRQLLDWTDDLDQNLIMVSASQGFYTTVKLILSMNGNPNRIDVEGRTALDLCADAGYFQIAHLLVQNGADASKSLIFKKIFSNPQEFAGEMTKASEVMRRPVDTSSSSLGLLGQSACDGDVISIQRLLGSATGPSLCDIEEGAEHGRSPFLLACLKNHFQAMDLLLSRGANINATSKQGWTSLMLAAKRDDEDCVSYLLSRGADVNHLSPDRWTALTEATSKGSIKVMEMLLDSGADPEAREKSDWTPLMHAAYRGDLAAVELLLSKGASFHEVSTHDETTMLLAAASGSPAVVKRLLDAGCAADSTWSMSQTGISSNSGAIDGESTEATSALVQTAEERIERAYKVGWTPLMVAAQIGSLESVRMLLDAGANPASQSPMFKTVIEIASENGRTGIAEYLAGRLS
ncbi:ankyrin repeat-containing domain protein [Nemania sp. FL0916]|nr:ankyrin repeat-containing domain protein [Nemania sp. FL0916]